MQTLFFNTRVTFFNYKLLYSVILATSLYNGSAITNVVFATETDSTDGAELYHDYCSVCHGDKGDGHSRAKKGLSTPPRDFTIPGLGNAISRDQMVDIVLNGRPGTAMAGWGTRLSRAQAEIIVDYVRNTFMSLPADTVVTTQDQQTKTTMSATQIAQPMPDGLTGNFHKGKIFYQANCATCHGISGEGNGPRAYFINPKPRNFLEESSRMRLNRPILFYAIKFGIKGKEMPAWGQVINDQQIADVAEYVFREMIQ
jgi:mono/diheme cytochrome c family protein